MRTTAIITLLAMALPAFPKEKEPLSAALQKVRETYIESRTNADGRVTRPGSVLVVQIDGVMANPRLTGFSQPYFSDFASGQIAPSKGLLVGATNGGAGDAEPLPVGAQVYLIGVSRLSNASNSIAMQVLTCGSCKPGTAVRQPLAAMVDFKFPRGFLATASFDQIKQVIDQVFKSQEDIPPPSPGPAEAKQGAVPEVRSPLRLPATYSNAQTPGDQLQLNADNTLSLQEAGLTYRGTFKANGNTLGIHIDPDTDTTATIDGNKVTDASGQTWVLREQSGAPAPAEGAFRNQDIIELVKAGLDDATILAKIASSKCQFHTSTDALIQLKSSGVSAAVIKAMVGAGTAIPPTGAPVVTSYGAAPTPPLVAPTPLTPPDGSVFDTFPRTTAVSWTAVAGAVQYRVEVDFAFSGVWASEYTPRRVRPRIYFSKTTSLSFDFVGAQPGRWRVSALDREGHNSEPSPWWGFQYSR